ncbi:hypothetical protein [Altericista sp. CCNU0014]|uniref:hypothetical protein n=1 Tax=Altericista sp. CCNU0014 TaxID=3082949 RepID=UPI0038503434
MINPFKTSLLLLATLILFSNQPQVKAEREVSALPVLQPNLVALEEEVRVWPVEPDPALLSLTAPLPVISTPTLPELEPQTQVH